MVYYPTSCALPTTIFLVAGHILLFDICLVLDYGVEDREPPDLSELVVVIMRIKIRKDISILMELAVTSKEIHKESSLSQPNIRYIVYERKKTVRVSLCELGWVETLRRILSPR